MNLKIKKNKMNKFWGKIVQLPIIVDNTVLQKFLLYFGVYNNKYKVVSKNNLI